MNQVFQNQWFKDFLLLRKYLFGGFAVACFCCCLVGCGGGSDNDAAELLRRQKLREASRLNQKKTPQERIEQAEKDFQLKNYKNALATIQPLLIETPDDIRVILLTAKCQAELDNKLEAAKLIQSIPADNQDIQLRDRYLAADWFFEISQYEKAQEVLSDLLRQDATRKGAHRKMAEVFHAQGRRFDAASHLRLLARLNDATEMELFSMNSFRDPFIDSTIEKPNFQTLVPAALVEAKFWHGDGDITKSRSAAMTLAKKFPESTPIAAFLMRVLAEEQDEAELLKQLKKPPAAIDREPEYWYSLGLMHRWQGKNDVAVRCFCEAVSRDDTDRASYLALSQTLRLLGKNDDADLITKRHDLLLESSRLAAKFGVAEGSAEDLNRMAEIMDQVHRPWEAIAWKKVLLRREGSPSERAKLQARREQLAQDDIAAWPTTAQSTCGIGLENYSLPTLDAIESAPKLSAMKEPLIADRPIVLRDVASKIGLQFQYNPSDDPKKNATVYLHQLTGGGIGVIDFDHDGWMDLYLTQGGKTANDPANEPNRLYRNIDGKSFAKVNDSGSEDRSYGQGVAAADINQDGFIDLVVANIGRNVLCINQGDGTFRKQELSSQADGKWTTSIAIGDLNRDHLPDIVEINYVDDPTVFDVACNTQEEACKPSSFRPATDRIWQATTAGQYEPFQSAKSLDELPNYGFAGLIANFDDEIGNDVFIANDTENNFYWVSNQPESSPSNEAPVSLVESSQVKGCGMGLLGQRQGCMGLANGDFDRNGTLDLHITNFWNQPADLYMQQKSGVFLNGVAKLGIRAASRETVGWGTQAADFDRNGWLDLAVLNGHLIERGNGEPYAMMPQLFRGSYEGFKFVQPASESFWSKRAHGRTMALVDFNRDGKPDVVAGHMKAPLAVLENGTDAGNYLQLELIGTKSERDAVGAKIQITAENQTWTSWVTGGDGFLCTNEPVIDFGIGAFSTIDQVTITWPSGQTQSFQDVPANTRYVATESESKLWQRE